MRLFIQLHAYLYCIHVLEVSIIFNPIGYLLVLHYPPAHSLVVCLLWLLSFFKLFLSVTDFLDARFDWSRVVRCMFWQHLSVFPMFHAFFAPVPAMATKTTQQQPFSFSALPFAFGLQLYPSCAPFSVASSLFVSPFWLGVFVTLFVSLWLL